jgi:hypothetical protein
MKASRLAQQPRPKKRPPCSHERHSHHKTTIALARCQSFGAATLHLDRCGDVAKAVLETQFADSCLMGLDRLLQCCTKSFLADDTDGRLQWVPDLCARPEPQHLMCKRAIYFTARQHLPGCAPNETFHCASCLKCKGPTTRTR